MCFKLTQSSPKRADRRFKSPYRDLNRPVCRKHLYMLHAKNTENLSLLCSEARPIKAEDEANMSRYRCSSQTWPFPRTHILNCHRVAQSGTVPASLLLRILLRKNHAELYYTEKLRLTTNRLIEYLVSLFETV